MFLNSRLPVLPRPAWWGGAMLAMALGLALQGDAGRVVDRLFASAIETLRQTRGDRPPTTLPDFHVRVEAKAVDGVARNLSGLAWDAQRGQLWSVINEPPQLLALSTDGEVLARYPLDGFHDVEGVAWLGDDLLLLVEERKQALVVVRVPDHPGQVLPRRQQRALTLALGDGGNQGFEGVAYDRDGDRLFVVKEHSPRKLYEIRGLRASLEGRLDVEVIDREAWIANKFVARDFSSVEYDTRSGHVILLSDTSRLVLELDAAGEFVGFQPLAGGFAGLREHVPQAEGMTFDERGNLYVVSEPNLFYAFRPD
ncbi:SdiA-regulated domain-containing protein [Aromatoleum diolicum]|uniref:DNA-binding protein n=1 Tax=Aromatoleum diolicum TaxID=75796 RepID=A0ABX1QJH9_9RHOO|nr:SdiA-regulated domain-containing protein [Aromatoleum diolicum]NMG77440.1 DNA-binding protein [Aromatoleum diolicum]